MANRKNTVAIIHPDLGIGGAEQLIINLALALQDKGYMVKVFTPHFDPNHCFKEAREKLDVEVHGNIFPRHVFGRFIAFCAYIRMLLCALWVILFGGNYEYYVIDQVSFPIPLLRLRSRKVLFYCHYPDKLLSTQRNSIFKKIYRFFLDLIEEVTTGMARCIVVNSNFTLKIFQDNFPLIRKFCRNQKPEILYPSIQESSFRVSKDFNQSISDLLGKQVNKDTIILTSLNRYERKKNVALALKSFAKYLEMTQGQDKDVFLVIAGGYDTRIQENVEHHLELQDLSFKLSIKDKVVFLRSISNDQRLLLLKNTRILLYTPENEHFGIVPVEAMYLGCIVMACNSGGPLESIDEGKTGFLLSPDEDEWSKKIHRILNFTQSKREELIENGKKRVQKMFTNKVFAEKLDDLMKGM